VAGDRTTVPRRPHPATAGAVGSCCEAATSEKSGSGTNSWVRQIEEILFGAVPRNGAWPQRATVCACTQGCCGGPVGCRWAMRFTMIFASS